MAAGIYNIREHTKGDTWNGLTIQVSTDGTPDNLTGAEIEIVFRDEFKRERARMSVGDGITLSDPGNGTFTIDEQIIDWPGTTYTYDIEITYASGKVKTYVKGQWPILADDTY